MGTLCGHAFIGYRASDTVRTKRASARRGRWHLCQARERSGREETKTHDVFSVCITRPKPKPIVGELMSIG